MRTASKILLIIAAALVVVGSLSFVVVMSVNRWDFTAISTEKYNTARHDITDSFHSISVDTTTTDITVLPAEDGVARVVCFENEKTPHEVSVTDGVLTVKRVDNRHHWTDYITIFDFHNAKITVYLPEAAYAALTLKSSTGDTEIARGLQFESITVTATTGDVTCYASAVGDIRLTTDTGDVRLQGAAASAVVISTSTGDIDAKSLTVTGAVELSVSTGDTDLTSITCHTLTSTGGTGEIELDSVLVSGLMSIKRGTGDVSLAASDAGEINIETSTGDVEGTLLTAKIFLAHAGTGDVRVPDTTTGGTCKINTGTGSIRITLVG